MDIRDLNDYELVSKLSQFEGKFSTVAESDKELSFQDNFSIKIADISDFLIFLWEDAFGHSQGSMDDNGEYEEDIALDLGKNTKIILPEIVKYIYPKEDVIYTYKNAVELDNIMSAMAKRMYAYILDSYMLAVGDHTKYTGLEVKFDSWKPITKK